MTTGDELLLLAIDPGRRRIRAEGRLRFALRAAELADLGSAGRIAVGARRIEVLDSERLEDRRLNNVLHSLGTAAPPPGLKDWLRGTPRSLTIEYLSRLEDQKAVRVRRWRDRGGRTRNDILSVDLSRRRALLARLDTVIRPGHSAAPPTDHDRDRDFTLAALVQAAGLATAAYPGLRGIAARRRLAALFATDRLAPVIAGAALAADEEVAAALSTGADFLTRQLFDELSDLYTDFTTGSHGLGHDLDPGSWSAGGGGTGHHGGGHAGGGHHGGGHMGGDHGGW
jgi:uncharacterized membrane protein YgcG